MIGLDTFNYWAALGTVFLQLGTAYLFFEYFFLKEKYLSPYIGRFGLWMVCVVAITAATLSLVYSEYFGFVPCGLCWIQRGLIYSLIVLVIVSLWKNYKDRRKTVIVDHGIALSAIGALVSFYHHYVQMGGSEFVVCPTSGGDCVRRLVFEFGYVTFPLMAFTMFAFFIAVFLIYHRAHVVIP